MSGVPSLSSDTQANPAASPNEPKPTKLARKQETREKLIRAAASLFEKNGYNATGVDAVVSAAGVAKMTLYQHFPSKDQLVIAVVQFQADQQEAWIRNVMARTTVPKTVRPLELFRDLESWAKADAYLGAATIKAAAEFPALSHPVHLALTRTRARITTALAELLAECGYADSLQRAKRLKIVLDGAFVGAHGLDAVTTIRDANTLAAMVIQR
jgi:AcrR family transcriptional regulator